MASSPSASPSPSLAQSSFHSPTPFHAPTNTVTVPSTAPSLSSDLVAATPSPDSSNAANLFWNVPAPVPPLPIHSSIYDFSAFPASVQSILAEVRHLLASKLYRSALHLAQFLLPTAGQAVPANSSQNSIPLPTHLAPSHAIAYELIGDSLGNAEVGEWQRALGYYSAAMEIHRALASQRQLFPRLLCHLQAKHAECLFALEADTQALALLERVHVFFTDTVTKYVAAARANNMTPIFRNHPLPSHLLERLAAHYADKNNRQAAIDCLTQVLHRQPTALAPIQALIKLDVDPRTIIPQLASPNLKITHPWLPALMDSWLCAQASEFGPAISRLDTLISEYPNAPFLHTQKADLQYQYADDEETRRTYERAHELDPCMLDGSDNLALLYRQKGLNNPLTHLLSVSLSVSQTRPEVWVIAGLYADIIGTVEKSVKYLEKAFYLSPFHLPLHRAKSWILLHSLNNPASAIQAYKHAMTLSALPDMPLLAGLILSLLAAQEIKQALITCNNHLTLQKRNPKLLTLVAMVLSSSTEGVDKAKKALLKAILLDPKHYTAVVALCSLYANNDQLAAAIELLTEKVEKGDGNDEMLSLLGQLHAYAGRRKEAIYYYSQVVALKGRNGDSALNAAVKGLASLEEEAKVDPMIEEIDQRLEDTTKAAHRLT